MFDFQIYEHDWLTTKLRSFKNIIVKISLLFILITFLICPAFLHRFSVPVVDYIFMNFFVLYFSIFGNKKNKDAKSGYVCLL